MEEDFQIYKQHKEANRVLLVGPRGIIRKADHFIYVLKDPQDNSIRYIGQTNNLKRQLERHLYDKQDYSFVKTKSEWIFKLKALSLHPIIEVIETLPAPVERGMVNERESRWIFHLFQQRANLTNVHCIRMPRLYKAVKKSKVDFLCEPLDSPIWKKLLELQRNDQKEWAKINENLRSEA
jgi:hypothetical protein